MDTLALPLRSPSLAHLKGACAVPVYYFHIREGDELITDPEGSSIADDAEARDSAVKGARSLLAEAVHNGRLPLDDAIVVTDEGGATLFEVTYREAVSGDALH